MTDHALANLRQAEQQIEDFDAVVGRMQERIAFLEEANSEYDAEIERRKIEKAGMQVRIAELEAALNIIASGFKGDKVLADWEMSNIAAAAVAK